MEPPSNKNAIIKTLVGQGKKSAEKSEKKLRVDRGYLSHFLVEDFCLFRVWFLGTLWYAKISSELLDIIEQYRISFKRNTMVVNE